MSLAHTPLARMICRLRASQGDPEPPFPTRAFELILWENIAYLASDERRRRAFDALRESIGLEPERILRATAKQRRAVTAHGILADRFAEKLEAAARIAVEEFGGDLDSVVALPVAEAIRALRRFPGIGAPGAEKILLFTGREGLLAPDSNALRVLVRLGLVVEHKSYAKTYAAARELALVQLGSDVEANLEAHQRLRRHGQEVCRRETPLCSVCAVASDCAHAMAAEQTSGAT